MVRNEHQGLYLSYTYLVEIREMSNRDGLLEGSYF